MKVSCPFSCVLLLSFGVCFPPDHGKALRSPGGRIGLTHEEPSLLQAAGRMTQGCRCPQDLCSFFPKRPPGFGKEKAALQSRFQRQQGVRDPENEEAVNYLPEEGGEKRAGALGSLAEELSGYHRKKGGFSFRFGRRKKIDICF